MIKTVWQQVKGFAQDDQELLQLCIQYSQKSFLCFVYAICQNDFEIRDFHEVIAENLEALTFAPPEQPKRITLSAPPRSGKSTITQLFVCWLMGLNGSASHIFASYGQRLSTSFTNKVHLFLQRPNFKLCFTNYTGFEGGSKTQLSAGGVLLATSVGGAITGFTAGTSQTIESISSMREVAKSAVLFGTPGVLVCDDPLKSGSSEAELDALADWWIDEANTRRTGNWIQLVIATRFSVRDLHGNLDSWDGDWSLANPSGWRNLNFKGLWDGVGVDPIGRTMIDQALWPGHATINQPELIKLRSINPFKFATVYQGTPTGDNLGMLNPADLSNKVRDLDQDIIYKVMAIDASFGLGSNPDSTGVAIVGLSADGDLWLLDSVRLSGDFVSLRQEIKDLLSIEAVDEVVVELAANGVALYQEMVQSPERYGFDGLVGGLKATLSKERRLSANVDLIRRTRWIRDFGALRQELLAFPHGESDDLVDALVWALSTIRVEFEAGGLDESVKDLEPVSDNFVF